MKKLDVVLEIMDCLASPILTHCSLWKDSIPERLKKVINMERLMMRMQNKEYAGDAECVAFIMTRSFESPMGHDWTDIYTHLGAKVCEQFWQENHWDQVKAPRELTDYQENYLLMPLRLWIYKKRREHLKARMKAEQSEDNMQVEDILSIIDKQASHAKPTTGAGEFQGGAEWPPGTYI